MTATPPSENRTATAGVIAPPPLIYLAGLGAGLLADWLLRVPPIPLAIPLRIAVGLALALLGIASIALALSRFGQADTPPEPWKPTTALTTQGIYRVTRNPMYLGMALLLAALAITFASWGTIVALPIVLIIVNRFVIQREEHYLTGLFGSEYDQYRSKVRRWL